jgi:nitrous oxidase accessory protein NosD
VSSGAASRSIGSGASSSPACGEVLTRNVRLTHDLTGCPGAGLVVGADGITIDLGGHAVRGNGGTSLTDGIGIVLQDRSHVTIRNGEVAGFFIGVLLVGNGTRNLVTELDSHGHADKSVVLFGDGLTGNTVSANRLHDDGDGGIGIFNGPTGTLVSHNLMVREAVGAVENNFADRTVVVGNTILDTGSGVIVESSDHLRITGNVVRRAPAGLCDGCGIGVQIYGDDILVARNLIIEAERFGIELDDFQDPGHSPAIGNVISDNTVRHSRTGIAIGPEAGGTVLRTVVRRNTVTGSVQDGIQLVGPSTGLETSTLTGNIANRNGGYGIETVPGTVDGGHNRARDNGQEAQCLNITCLP